jgi:hypothetical protein
MGVGYPELQPDDLARFGHLAGDAATNLWDLLGSYKALAGNHGG